MLVWTFLSVSPAVWMYDFIFDARLLLAAMGTLIYEGQGRCNVSHCGSCEKEGQAYIPSGSYFLCMWLHLYEFVLSVHLWAESCSQLWGWCEVTSAWQGGCGIQSESLFFSCSSSYSLEKHNLQRLGCENKNENTSTQSGGNKLRREESCCLEQHGFAVCFPSLTSVRFCL